MSYQLISMAVIQEVEQFLSEFKAKLSIWGVFFRDDRGKNASTITGLEITQVQRENFLKQLKPSDYCEGPLNDTLNKGPDLWVFGVYINDTEVYIKISLGFPCSGVKCVSFHLAEHPLRYPFK